MWRVIVKMWSCDACGEEEYYSTWVGGDGKRWYLCEKCYVVAKLEGGRGIARITAARAGDMSRARDDAIRNMPYGGWVPPQQTP